MSTALEKVESLLVQLSPGEKAQVLEWVIRDLGKVFPGIEKTAGVCGGEARIAHTRIPVWLLVRQRQLGISDQQILQGYPSLTAESLANAWQYYRSNREEIENDVLENENA
jgi:uncharacterized protein (DUF433 family)